MSTPKHPTIIRLIDARETVAKSIVKDTYTFACLGLMAVLSHGSVFWQTICGIMLFCMVIGKISSLGGLTKSFSSHDDLIAWAERDKAVENLRQHLENGGGI